MARSTIQSEEGRDPLFVKELMAETTRDAVSAVKAAAVHLEGAVKRTLSGQRSGRRYFVEGQNATYTASRPGEAPASQLGTLRTAVQHTGPEVIGQEISANVGVDLDRVPYARRLELGGFHVQPEDVSVRLPDGWIRVRAGTVIRTAPRPFLRSTFLREESRVDAILREWLA